MCMYLHPLSLVNTIEVQWKVTGAEKERGSQPNYNGCIIRTTLLQMPFAGHLLLLYKTCGFCHLAATFNPWSLFLLSDIMVSLWWEGRAC